MNAQQVKIVSGLCFGSRERDTKVAALANPDGFGTWVFVERLSILVQNHVFAWRRLISAQSRVLPLVHCQTSHPKVVNLLEQKINFQRYDCPSVRVFGN